MKITYEKLIQDSILLSQKIKEKNVLNKYDSVYGIPNGGILPGYIISNELDLPLISNPDENTLIVDDLIDSGKTLEKYPLNDSAVLYRKGHSPKTTYYLEEYNEWLELPHEKEETGIEEHFTRILEYVGENPLRTGLKDTPARMARFYKEAFKGYKECDLRLTTFPNNDDGIVYDQIVYDDGYFYSFREHHMIPFFGEYYIGYIPDKKVIGLSKIAQIVDYYCARLQIQERVVSQIADKLEKILEPKGVVVILKGRHLCREVRDVKKHKAKMITSVMRGVFREDSQTRDEFLKLCKLN